MGFIANNHVKYDAHFLLCFRNHFNRLVSAKHNSHATLLVLGKFQLLDYSRNIC